MLCSGGVYCLLCLDTFRLAGRQTKHPFIDAKTSSLSEGDIINIKTISCVVLILLLPLSYFMVEGSKLQQSIPSPPPLPEAREKIYEFYKLKYMADGYPGKETSDGVIAHPIYGAYVINDYCREYKKNGDDSYLRMAINTADATINRMEAVGEALVFYYPPGLSAIPHRFYSGLTQARYLTVFSDLAGVSGDSKYSAAAERVLNSLCIPVEDGGVLKKRPGGSAIEEYPHEPPLYTLNGWTTAMILIKKYAVSHKNGRADELFVENLNLLKKLLPLYDLPELANSRYNLAGNVDIRFVFDTKFKGIIKRSTVIIPGEGRYPVLSRGANNKWINRFTSGGRSKDSNYVVEDKVVQANVLLSMISGEKPNYFEAEIESGADDVELEFQLNKILYEPVDLKFNDEWMALKKFTLRKGLNRIRVEIPWNRAWLVAHPTVFTKRIAGKNYNTYHYLHIKNMKALFKLSGDPLLKEYMEKWMEYTGRWPEMPVYRNYPIEFKYYQKIL